MLRMTNPPIEFTKINIKSNYIWEALVHYNYISKQFKTERKKNLESKGNHNSICNKDRKPSLYHLEVLHTWQSLQKQQCILWLWPCWNYIVSEFW